MTSAQVIGRSKKLKDPRDSQEARGVQSISCVDSYPREGSFRPTMRAICHFLPTNIPAVCKNFSIFTLVVVAVSSLAEVAHCCVHKTDSLASPTR